MTDLEERLRSDLPKLAQLVGSHAAEASTAPLAPQDRTRHSRRWLTMAAAVAAAAVIAVLGWTRLHDGNPIDIDAAQDSSVPPVRSPQIFVESDGLLDGTTTVTVSGEGFEPATQVGVAQCSAAPQTEAFSDLCAGGAVSAMTDQDGRFTAAFTPSTQIKVPATGDVDCAASPGACVLAAAPIGETSTVAIAMLSFTERAAGPYDDASIVVLGPIEQHEGRNRVHVEATGFPAGERVAISVCVKRDDGSPDVDVCDLEHSLIIERFDPGRTNAGELVLPRLEGDTGVLDCAATPDRCIITTGSTTTPTVSTPIQP